MGEEKCAHRGAEEDSGQEKKEKEGKGIKAKKSYLITFPKAHRIGEILVKSLFESYHGTMNNMMILVGEELYRIIYSKESIEFMNKKENKKYFITLSEMIVVAGGVEYKIPAVKRRFSAHVIGGVKDPSVTPLLYIHEGDTGYGVIKRHLEIYKNYKKARGNFLYQFYTFIKEYQYTSKLKKACPSLRSIVDLAMEERYHEKTVEQSVAHQALTELDAEGFHGSLTRFGFGKDCDVSTIELDVDYGVLNNMIERNNKRIGNEIKASKPKIIKIDEFDTEVD